MRSNIDLLSMRFATFKYAIFKLTYGKEDNYALFYYLTNDARFATEEHKSIQFGYETIEGFRSFGAYRLEEILYWAYADRRSNNMKGYYTQIVYVLMATNLSDYFGELDITDGKLCFSINENKLKEFADSLPDNVMSKLDVSPFIDYVKGSKYAQ